MFSVIAGLALALLLAVIALVREVRLRRALQELLRRLLTHWRNRFAKEHDPIAVAALWFCILMVTSGCQQDDGRLARWRRKQPGSRPRKTKRWTRLNREVAAGTKQLVEGDAKARQELIAAQRDLQRQQEQVGAQRDALEAERKEWAQQRRTESVYAPILSTLGMTLLAILPLVLCWYLLQGLGRTNEEQIGEILIEDIISEEPQLLPAPPTSAPSRVLEYQPELAEQDAADEGTLPG